MRNDQAMSARIATPNHLPVAAGWRHIDAREGFEVLFIDRHESGWSFSGRTAAIEADEVWTVGYVIDVDLAWRTLGARITGRSVDGERSLEISSDGDGYWRADGIHRPELDGCLDLDLESSAFTNALPVQRLQLPLGAEAQAPAAYVRAAGLQLERLEQRYTRLDDDVRGQRYDYEAARFEFRAQLQYDRAGLVLTYPGIAIRVG
jgi:hypothetical protein